MGLGRNLVLGEFPGIHENSQQQCRGRPNCPSSGNQIGNTLSSWSLYLVTDGDRCKDPEPTTRPSSGSSVEQREEDFMSKELKAITRKSTDTAGLSSWWEFKGSRPTVEELSWGLTRPCMWEIVMQLFLFQKSLVVGPGSVHDV